MSRRSLPFIAAGLLAIMTLGSAWGDPALARSPHVTVRAGQTLSGIAAAHGTSVARLARLNDISDPDRIYVGQRLRLPRAQRAQPQHRDAKPVRHVVGHGETLTGIAARYGSTVSAIARANHLHNASYIRAGDRLVIPPGKAPAGHHKAGSHPTRQRATVHHRVALGETLSGIAVRYGTTTDAIARANHLADASFIRAGEVLAIPGGSRPVRRARPGGVPASMAQRVAARDAVRRLIVREARRQGVAPAFALAVAWQESGWQQQVVSSAGAIGIMQLLPATGDWVSEAMLGQAVNLRAPASNVRAGVRLLRHYLDRYGGSRELALAAYYQGQTATDLHGVYAVSRPYIASILVLEAVFRR